MFGPNGSVGILAFDPPVVEVARAASTDGDATARPGANEHHRDSGMRRDRRDQVRMHGLELLEGEAVIVPSEVDKAEVARANDRDRPLFRQVKLLGGLRVDVDEAVAGGPARERQTCDGAACPSCAGNLGQERVDERRTLAMRSQRGDVRAATHQPSDELGQGLAIALLERRSKALAVIR